MKYVLEWVKLRRQGSIVTEADSAAGEAVGPAKGILVTGACAFLSILASALLSGTLVFCIVRFGARGGLPPLEFRGALSVALLGTWFSMGSSQPSERNIRDFPKYLGRTLAHQVGCALLMLVLLGVLTLGLGGR